MKTFAFLLFSFLLSCSDRPKREKFPGPQGQTTDSSRAQSAREVMGGTDSFSAKLEKAAAENSQITGQIILPEGKKLPAKYFLFISARKHTGGPPLAVRREKDPALPYSFKLGQNDVMIPGTVFEGLVEVTARIDQDGDPLSRTEGDLAGIIQATVGQKNLSITLE